jgi:diguanylate cyclase (GGDEF)-like protein/PAS domain S-box-containing protein
MSESTARILVVDDDATALVLMRAALQKSGFEVQVANSGEQALQMFRGTAFDLVMLDVDMPGMSGFEVCATLRTEGDALLPIVMVTGMDDLESVQTAYQSGATDFIAKPLNWALLGHRAKYLMRGHQALLDLQAANARTTAILKALPDLMFEVDLDGRYIDVNSTRPELLFAPAEKVLGKTVGDVLPPAAAAICMAALLEAFEKGLSLGKQYQLNLEHGVFWFELSISRKEGSSTEKPSFIVLSRDITERKDAEQKILRLAMFDHLTGLPNRQSFLDRVEREIQHARRLGTSFGVLFMDLDGFKNINDTMGHSAGDLALQWAADRLREGVRPSDHVSRSNEPGGDIAIARLGGDEFTAIIVDIKRAEDALVVARRILEMMRRPFVLLGREMSLTTSIGIAMYPDDGQDAASLLTHADTAMYSAKEAGRDNHQFYNAALTELVVHRMALEAALRFALEHREFSLVYQPQIDVASGRIDSVEALLRWNRPGYGVIPPMEFIAAAEQCGLIASIGKWVLQNACTQAVRWQRDGHPLRLAVNLSPLQFKDPNLVQTVLDTLAETGLHAECLELELTEGTVMADTSATMATLEAFRSGGVSIALDDFGTGYSSLSYLKRMPLNRVKIDQSFVAALPQDLENTAIIKAILAMATSLGLRVTAEGVETAAQAGVLQSLGCHSLQGYFFGKPVAADRIPELLEKNWNLPGLP